MTVEISRCEVGVEKPFVVNVFEDVRGVRKSVYTCYCWSLEELFDGSCTSIKDLLNIFLCDERGAL